MIQIDFSSDFLDKDIAKLSVISDADSFVYGLFDHQHCMVHRGKLLPENAALFIKDWQDKGVTVHYMSPSAAFTHLPVNEQDGHNNPNIYRDHWVDENILCFYEDAAIINSSWDYKHITTASFQYYSLKNDKRIWLHFLDQSVSLRMLKSCRITSRFSTLPATHRRPAACSPRQKINFRIITFCVPSDSGSAFDSRGSIDDSLVELVAIRRAVRFVARVCQCTIHAKRGSATPSA